MNTFPRQLPVMLNPLRLMMHLLVLLVIFMLMSALAYSQDYDVETGLTAFEARDYPAALENFTEGAIRGHPLAQFNLGLMYDRGEGVAQDFHEAYYWYSQAAEQGSADGQYAVGTMNFYGQGMRENFAEALLWYQESARQGHRDSQYNSGVMQGIGRINALFTQVHQ
jgi:TPR repeat protein